MNKLTLLILLALSPVVRADVPFQQILVSEGSYSMYPLIVPGDVLLVRPVLVRDLKVGDVIVFRPIIANGSTTCHEVVSISKEGHVVTKGINNSHNDPFWTVQSRIVGKVWSFYYRPGGSHE